MRVRLLWKEFRYNTKLAFIIVRKKDKEFKDKSNKILCRKTMVTKENRNSIKAY
jgi:hypothetical protein